MYIVIKLVTKAVTQQIIGIKIISGYKIGTGKSYEAKYFFSEKKKKEEGKKENFWLLILQ